MATYKVIQDIEADDKFVGPLTLKQFVFAMAGIFFAYLSFFAISRGFAFALIVFVPPMLLFIFLAIPWSKHQPTEIWVIAKLRYLLKPRKRIWDQTGMEELVTITVPKKEEKQLTKDHTQDEVKSRLKALATTIDSRGWAVKDLQQNTSAYQSQPRMNAGSSDRLIDSVMLPKQSSTMDAANLPDAYDGQAQTGQNFDKMIQQSSELRRDYGLKQMDQVRSGKPIKNEQDFHITPPGNPSVTDLSEAKLNKELKSRKKPDSLSTAHMRRIDPSGAKKKSDTKKHGHKKHKEKPKAHTGQPAENTSDTPNNTAILGYAGNNDLDVATIARQAKKDSEGEEVVISLR